jgi:hypothetical protein
MARSDDIPSAFLTYLGQRLGKDDDAAAELLGEWLASYEPRQRVERRDLDALSSDELTA